MPSKGFTLTEILIATVLMGLVVLTVASVDITSRRFLAASKEQMRVQDEAKIAMEHMVRNFVQAHEIYDFGSRDADPYTIGVRLDIDPTTRWPHTTPNIDGDDTWIVYRFVSVDPDADNKPTIRCYSDAASAPGSPPPPPPAGGWASWLNTPYEVIVTDIFVDGTSPAMFTVTDNQIDIDITAQEEDTSINLQTSVISRSMSAT